VNVAMHYCLTGSHATIDPYVETQHSRVLLKDEISGFNEQLLARSCLSGAKVKVTGSMPLRDNE
jgi:hypothetical protein